MNDFQTITVSAGVFTVEPYSGSNAPDEFIVYRCDTDFAAVARKDSAGVSLSPFGTDDGDTDPDESTYRDELLTALDKHLATNN